LRRPIGRSPTRWSRSVIFNRLTQVCGKFLICRRLVIEKQSAQAWTKRKLFKKILVFYNFFDHYVVKFHLWHCCSVYYFLFFFCLWVCVSALWTWIATLAGLMGCLHDPANVQQTSSKCIQNARANAERLLDRVNTLLAKDIHSVDM